MGAVPRETPHRGTIAYVYDFAVTRAAALRKRQRVRTNGRTLVNLGSGMEVAPGWVNVDLGLPALIAGWPLSLIRAVYRVMPSTSAAKRDYTEEAFCERLATSRFVHHEARYGMPFNDAAVDFIFTSHFLEHLYLSDARTLLQECLRVLRPGGVLRVCVPDLDYATALIARGDIDRGLEYFFYDRGPSDLSRHRHMYNADSLRAELQRAGFVGISRRRFREGAVPDLDVLDNRPEETLYMEATR